MSVPRGKKSRNLDNPQWGEDGRDPDALHPARFDQGDWVGVRECEPWPLRAPDSPTPFDDPALADHYRLAVEALELHDHTVEGDGNILGGEPFNLRDCPETCVVAWNLLQALSTLRDFDNGENVPEWRGTRDAHIWAVGEYGAKLETLRRGARYHRTGRRVHAGGEMRGAAQTAERAATDAETWPDGPPQQEPLSRTCEVAGERDRVTEDRARRRRTGQLPPRACSVCRKEFQPKRANARECPSCRKLTTSQKTRRKAHLSGE